MNKPEHIFFDLDNTLWDFSKNSDACLKLLFNNYELINKGIPGETAFLNMYAARNLEFWAMYREGRIDQLNLRWQRFWKVLSDFGFNDKATALKMSESYLDLLGEQTILCAGAREILDDLLPHYKLEIITNGFEEVQQRKMIKSDLLKYFNSITTSESADAVKPNPKIYNKAIKSARAKFESSVYIGDSSKVDGSAKDVGMEFIWYNPDKLENSESHAHSITHLSELKDIFL